MQPPPPPARPLPAPPPPHPQAYFQADVVILVVTNGLVVSEMFLIDMG